MALAEKLGKTLGELEHMPLTELREWEALYAIRAEHAHNEHMRQKTEALRRKYS